MAVSTTKNVKQKAVEPKNGINWKPEWGELVKVFVPTEDGDESPFPVCLNGDTVWIPRNEWHEVPDAIKQIIDQSHAIIVESEKRNKKFEEGKLDLSSN
jgi:hypothetical protein